MAYVSNDTNITVTRDYSDINAIKETAINTLKDRYFKNIELSGLNVGEFGFILEQIGNVTEDSFNTAMTVMNEMFPNKAFMPESIYSHAAVFQLNSNFSTPSECTFVMLIDQNDIMKYGNYTQTSDGNSHIEFFIDKKTIFIVEGIEFTLDYDIKVIANCKEILNGEKIYTYLAHYVFDEVKNSISNIVNPYLKIRTVPRYAATGDSNSSESTGYILLQFTAHQVKRNEYEDTITTDIREKNPIFEYNFEDSLAGFDVFYKSPTSDKFIQLDKIMKFSLPIKKEFCYYRFKNHNTIEISFSSSAQFQPEVNSEIKVILYITTGSTGNFETYNGNNIEIRPCTDTYKYSDKIALAIKPAGASTGGSDGISNDSMRLKIIKEYSSTSEISTEKDVEEYFNSYKNKNDDVISAFKRHDFNEKLISTFLLIRDGNYTFPTNTLDINISLSDFNIRDAENGIYTLLPGHVFIYDDTDTSISKNTLVLAKTIKKDNDDDYYSYSAEENGELIDKYEFYDDNNETYYIYPRQSLPANFVATVESTNAYTYTNEPDMVYADSSYVSSGTDFYYSTNEYSYIFTPADISRTLTPGWLADVLGMADNSNTLNAYPKPDMWLHENTRTWYIQYVNKNKYVCEVEESNYEYLTRSFATTITGEIETLTRREIFKTQMPSGIRKYKPLDVVYNAIQTKWSIETDESGNKTVILESPEYVIDGFSTADNERLYGFSILFLLTNIRGQLDDYDVDIKRLPPKRRCCKFDIDYVQKKLEERELNKNIPINRLFTKNIDDSSIEIQMSDGTSISDIIELSTDNENNNDILEVLLQNGLLIELVDTGETIGNENLQNSYSTATDELVFSVIQDNESLFLNNSVDENPWYDADYENTCEDLVESTKTLTNKFKNIGSFYFDICNEDGEVITTISRVYLNIALKLGYAKKIYKKATPVMSYNEEVTEIIQNNEYVFVCPYFISLHLQPDIVGIYQNIRNQSSLFTYKSSDDNALEYFTTSKIYLKRGITESSEYDLSLSIIPSSSTDTYVEAVVDDNGNITYKSDCVRIIVAFTNKYGIEIGYIELLPTSINNSDKTNVTFSTKLKTLGEVVGDTVSIRDVITGPNKTTSTISIPISNEIVYIYILYNDGLHHSDNKLMDYFNDLDYFGITNIYSTESDPLSFCNPMNMMRSVVTHLSVSSDENHMVKLSSIPVIKAGLVNDTDKFEAFVEKMSDDYNYIEEILPDLRNTTFLNVKFYNTYGRSKNYYITDGLSQNDIDRINTTIKLQVFVKNSVDTMELKTQLSIYIKKYIEGINLDGKNELNVSNLIKSIETNFPLIHHMKFYNIDQFETDYQMLGPKVTDYQALSKYDKNQYVPEYLTIDLSDIDITFTSI